MDGERNTKRNLRSEGTHYEQLAAGYMERLGYRILERNFRCRIGEIDLIARDGDTIVFTEVKYRSSSVCGSAEDAVHPGKQRTIYRTAQFYLTVTGLAESTPCRFDVIAVQGQELRHYKNAFGGM